MMLGRARPSLDIREDIQMLLEMHNGRIGAVTLALALSGSAVAQGPESDFEAWQSIKDDGTCADYRGFVSRYPDSRLRGLVAKRVAECDRADRAKEDSAWAEVTGSERCSDYTEFLVQHPSGARAAEAQAGLEACVRRQGEAAAALAAERAAREEAERAEREREQARARERADADRRAREQARRAEAEKGCGNRFWSAEALERNFGGHTWAGRSGEVSWQEYYAPGGLMYGRAQRGGSQRPPYVGRWYLSGDRYCYCTADCREYACRKVRQMSGCPGSGEAWTWNIENDSKRSEIKAIYSGDYFGLSR